MKKKLTYLLWSGIIGINTLAAPLLTTANFNSIRPTTIGLPGWDQGWAGNEWFLDFVQSGVNYILTLLWLITIIILVYGGFQMLTAWGDDSKYKKWFTIVKQAVVGLILIGVSALIVNMIFYFINANTTTGWSTWW